LLAQAREISLRLGDKLLNAWSLFVEGVTQLDRANYEPASALLTESVALWKIVGNPSGAAMGLDALGQLVMAVKARGRARSILYECLALWESIKAPWGIACAECALGELALGENQPDEASQRLRKGLQLHRRVGSKRGQIECLEALAATAMARDQPQRAALLLAAADSQRRGIHVPLPPRRQPERERQCDRLRSQLGEESFWQAWTDGGNMNLQQAVDLGLAEASA
jgi:hypothetical protein